MKRFAGSKTLEQIRAQCDAAGLALDAERHEKNGDDHVVVRGGGGEVFYRTFNGRFFGTTDTGIEFNSDSTEHEQAPWFQQLLAFFYVDKAPANG
jgi:hypothetical protein